MDVTISQEQGRVPVSVIQIAGKTDSASAEEFRIKVLEEIERGARYIVLDLSKVPYMSSAGLRVLNEVFNKLRELSPEDADQDIYKHIADGSYNSPHMKLLNPTKDVLEVLKMSGFDMLVSIEKDLNKAVTSF
ncbi:MAG: STAS domain-containing protein [Anaerolineae bacterium]|nr:STAS domain-containing protein [Anaerolineae bacterium]